MEPVDPSEAPAGAARPVPAGRGAARLHASVELGYRVRVPAHLFTLLILASVFVDADAAPWVWAMAVFYGLAWPHLARAVAVRARDSKAAEQRNLLVDAGFVGVFAALSGFSLWPSMALLTGIHSASLSIGGLKLGLRALAACAASAAAAGVLTGFRFTPDATPFTAAICALGIVGYCAVFALRTHLEANRLLHAQRELRAINARMQAQRRDVEHALALAETASRAKTVFLANMSHELRTPLNAIIGYAELLEEDADDATQRADLRRIHDAGRQLLGLINDVLDLSKIEAGKVRLEIEPFDPTQVVDEVVATMRPLLARNGNRIVLALEQPVGPMVGDATRLRQVLLNLASNANKFTSQGEIRLAARRAHDRGLDRVVFEVSDTGIGMTEAQVAKLFVPFEQADSATTRLYGGTGLGLAISQGMCELMGGRIEARSTHGEGSCFTVTLPARCRPPGEVAQPSGVAQPADAPPDATAEIVAVSGPRERRRAS